MNKLPITTIITDDPAFIVRQVRNDAGRPIDEATVTLYSEAPERLPPIEVWRDPATNQVYLIDGQHRIEAYRRRNLAQIPAAYFEGSRAEAEARARSANFKHGLRLTAAEQRQARLEVIERLYDYSNHWLAEDYLFCSSNTVAALRASLEEAGRIPALTRFKRKGGGTMPRAYGEAEEAEERPEEELEPPDGLEMAPDSDDEGYEGEADDPGGGPAPFPSASRGEEKAAPVPGRAKPPRGTGEGFEAEAPGLAGPEQTGSGGEGRPPHRLGGGETEGRDRPAKAGQTTLKLAQVGEALAVEVTLYVDGEAFSLPVTLLIAAGPIAGVPETAPGHHQVLVIDQATAGELRLLYA